MRLPRALILVMMLTALPTGAAEREYPTSGTVVRKFVGISAKHVTEASGTSAELERSYYVCIQRDPRSDPYADRWLVYRQCWDTTREVYDAVNVCDWFMVKDADTGEKSKTAGPTAKQFAKTRRHDARRIKKFHACD